MLSWEIMFPLFGSGLSGSGCLSAISIVCSHERASSGLSIKMKSMGFHSGFIQVADPFFVAFFKIQPEGTVLILGVIKVLKTLDPFIFCTSWGGGQQDIFCGTIVQGH